MPHFVLPADLTPLDAGSVDLWFIRLELDDDAIASARAGLAPDELARADRFSFEAPRRSFVARRWALRRLLGRYLGVDPAAIAFRYGEHGKPELASPVGDGLSFNYSQSGGCALLGVTHDHRIGVDLERRRSIRDRDELVTVCFSAAELASYRSLPSAEREAAFFNGWTRKEAFIKATGKGLVFPLRDFDVSLAPEEPPRLLRVLGEASDPAQWTLWAAEPADGFTAAVAVDAPDIVVRLIDAAGVLAS